LSHGASFTFMVATLVNESFFCSDSSCLLHISHNCIGWLLFLYCFDNLNHLNCEWKSQFGSLGFCILGFHNSHSILCCVVNRQRSCLSKVVLALFFFCLLTFELFRNFSCNTSFLPHSITQWFKMHRHLCICN